jgi:hypothetical protein
MATVQAGEDASRPIPKSPPEMGRALDESVMHNHLSLPVTDPHCVVVEVEVVRRGTFRGPYPVSAAVGRCREFSVKRVSRPFEVPAIIGARRWSPCSPCTVPSDSPRVSGAWLA